MRSTFTFLSLLSISSTVLVATTAQSGPTQCSSVFHEDKLIQPPLDAWNTGGFSDPRTYKVGDDFTFLVSGLRDLSILDKGIDIGAHQTIIFSSLITKEHPRPFFGNYGVILSAKPSNVGGTSPWDTTSSFPEIHATSTPTEVNVALEKYRKKHSTPALIAVLQGKQPNMNGLLTPKNILATTGKSSPHNEVVLAGTSLDGSIVSIQGLFFCTVNGVAKYPEDAVAIQTYAKKLGLPLVEIDLAEWSSKKRR